jgi:hypothetical protein
VSEIYWGAAQAIIEETGELDILCMAAEASVDPETKTYHARQPDLPTWAADWNICRGVFASLASVYSQARASGHSRARATFSSDGSSVGHWVPRYISEGGSGWVPIWIGVTRVGTRILEGYLGISGYTHIFCIVILVITHLLFKNTSALYSSSSSTSSSVIIPQSFKHIIIRTESPVSLFRFFVTKSLLTLKTLSDGADVAGIAKKSAAILLIIGNSNCFAFQ